MVFDIDSSRGLRTPDQIVPLLRAVLAASKEDESRSVEWKSGYADVTSLDASFAIGRAILGLANRPVGVASAAFEGVGYVIVGVEPGSLVGQEMRDSAELLNAIRRFTGHGWPYWDARSLTLDGMAVMVVTVEPPRDGDRIALLQKSYQPIKGALSPEGTIFVRQPGATERASRSDLEMLQDRILAGTEAARAKERKLMAVDGLRVIVADLVEAGGRWADTMEILVLATHEEWSQRNWIEWANSDSGREMTANALTVDRAARNIRLRSSDERLLDPVVTLQGLMKENESFDVIHKKGGRREERTAAYRALGSIKRALLQLENAMIEIVRDSDF